MTQTRAPADETGASLIEVLVAIVILGTAFAAILGGMATSILTSDIHRKEASANTVLVSAAEAITDETRNPYRPLCSAALPPYNPTAGVDYLPAKYLVKILLPVRHWNGAGLGGTATTNPFDDTCPQGTDTGLQQVTLVVRSIDNRAVEMLSVIKRRTT